jgi:hypothetical protein
MDLTVYLYDCSSGSSEDFPSDLNNASQDLVFLEGTFVSYESSNCSAAITSMPSFISISEKKIYSE